MNVADRTTIPRKRHFIRRSLLVLLVLLVMLLIAGGIYERVASYKLARKYPPPGKLVESDSRRNHVYIQGRGSPAVIFVSGTGEGYESWLKVQPEIAKFAETFSYDRAGLGWSERGTYPRDIGRIVSELHDLLGAAKIAPPYVLVGHSLGGGIVLLYAARYPKEVIGVVLVDGMGPDLLQRIPLDSRDKMAVRIAALMKVLAPLGVARIAGLCAVDRRPIIHCAEFWSTFLSERTSLPESCRQLTSVSSLDATPLVVLSCDPDPKVGWGSPELRSSWEKMQEELPKLSTDSRHIVVTGATHYIQLDRPQAVIDAVKETLAASKRTR